MKALVEKIVYNCHPETCSHKNHLPWCVRDTSSGVIVEKFHDKEGAEWFCSKHGLNYTVKELTWNDIF